MTKEPDYSWNEELGESTCTLYYNNHEFVGKSKCHEYDNDFKSERTGLHIAYSRAYIQYLKYVRDCEALPRYKALKHLYGTVKESPRFYDTSYAGARIIKELKNAEEELETIRALIKMNIEDLSLYIKEKDKFYQIQRNKNK